MNNFVMTSDLDKVLPEEVRIELGVCQSGETTCVLNDSMHNHLVWRGVFRPSTNYYQLNENNSFKKGSPEVSFRGARYVLRLEQEIPAPRSTLRSTRIFHYSRQDIISSVVV